MILIDCDASTFLHLACSHFNYLRYQFIQEVPIKIIPPEFSPFFINFHSLKDTNLTRKQAAGSLNGINLTGTRSFEYKPLLLKSIFEAMTSNVLTYQVDFSTKFLNTSVSPQKKFNQIKNVPVYREECWEQVTGQQSPQVCPTFGISLFRVNERSIQWAQVWAYDSNLSG